MCSFFWYRPFIVVFLPSILFPSGLLNNINNQTGFSTTREYPNASFSSNFLFKIYIYDQVANYFQRHEDYNN